jgi:RNA polymerase sigma factor (sigma-70 family)
LPAKSVSIIEKRKMLKSVPQPDDLAVSHENLFIARYQRLLGWALRLADGQRHLAEDLVHDAFIQFTLKRPNLAAIESLDDYLFVVLRNLHISQARRASQTPTTKLAISDYDTAEMGLRMIDPQRRLQARDDLRRVCEYASRRKETSKAASVLILRFFHVYFAVEIARVLNTTRHAVEIWLLNARRESRLYLEDPTALKLIGKTEVAKKVVRLPQRSTVISSDIFRELCETIFASRQGDCLNRDQLRQLYESEKTIECERLAHTVSCPNCLEIVNDLLGLSSLNERYKMESPDIDHTPPGEGGPPATSGGNGDAGEMGSRLRQRRRETIEHRPKELRIAVNGFFVGRQKIGMPFNELALKLNVEEKISFIEIFSEQGLLLSHFAVTPPTDGELEQREAVEFGEGRALEIAVSFNTQWPTLNIVYRDPLVAQLQDVVIEAGNDPINAALDSHDGDRVDDFGPDSLTSDPKHESFRLGRGLSLPGLRRRIRSAFRAQFWLRPGAITAVFALLLLAALLVVFRYEPARPLTAANVLQRATNAEQIAAANTSMIIHRTLQIEERRGSTDGNLLASRRVELWQSAAKGVSARRVYDDRGRLLAGVWTRSDNVTTLYQHGVRPKLRPSGTTQSTITLESVWQLSPSAADFAALTGQKGEVRFEERGDRYILSSGGAGGSGLINATLTLSRDDFHAVEQTLIVQQGTETRAYRIIETSFERRPNDAVAPAVFEPEPELLASAELNSRNPKLEAGTADSDPLSPIPVLATPALEVEVLQLLNQANAFMGEQVSVTRTSEGRLLISALVETDERRSELLRALAAVRNNPAVRTEIETVASASQRERPKSPSNSPSNVTIERVEATEGTSPAYADLRKRFSDDEARRYADRVITRSRQARRHALALKQLAERFSLTDLRTLSESDRARWIGLLREHARDFQREVQGLRRDLQQVFPALSEPGTVMTRLSVDTDIQESARRLYQFGVSVDEGVRQSFALSSQAASVPHVKTDSFWQLLKSAESSAAQIVNAD